MVRIRRAGLEDLPGVARVLVDTWRATYRGVVPEAFLEGLSYEGQAERWAQRLKTPTWPGRLFVAESESGEVVGFAAFGPDRASGFPGYTAELWAIYVLPNWQRKGLGRALFHEGARLLQAEGYGRMLVWVLKENPKGRGFYEHLGGVLLGEREIELGGAKLWEVAYGFDLGGHKW